MLAQCRVSCAAAVLINMQTNHLPKMVATVLTLDFNCCTYPLDLVSGAIDIGLVQLLCIDSCTHIKASSVSVELPVD